MNPYDEMRRMSLGEIYRGLIFQALLFVIIGISLWSLSGRELSSYVSIDLTQIAYGVALGAGLIAVAHGLFAAFPKYSEFLCRSQAKNFAFLEKNVGWGGIILISLCAGIGEEALFRGGLQTLLGDYVSLPLAIVASSIVFALIHFSKPIILLLIFIIGSLFGVAYWYTESLLAVMIAHALYDVYAIWYLKRMLHKLDAFPPPPEPLEEHNEGEETQ